jgi:hypothetical protein
VDQIGIFGGDEYAMAAASHELRGLATILGCNVPGVHIPLMGWDTVTLTYTFPSRSTN